MLRFAAAFGLVNLVNDKRVTRWAITRIIGVTNTPYPARRYLTRASRLRVGIRKGPIDEVAFPFVAS